MTVVESQSLTYTKRKTYFVENDDNMYINNYKYNINLQLFIHTKIL